MGDMIEDFRALKAAQQREKADTAVANVASLQALGIDAIEQSKHVFRIDREYGTVMYYPSSNKWQYRGKTFRGSPQALQAWLVKGK